MSIRSRIDSVNTDKKPTKVVKVHYDPFQSVKNKIQASIIKKLDIDFNEITDDNDELKDDLNEMINSEIELEALNITVEEEKKIAKELFDEILGFGPITALLNDDSIDEVMVNGPDNVYYEKEGKLIRSEATFKNNNHVLHVIKKIVGPIGRRIDESSPMVDARLLNGSRVNAIIAPLSIDGASITIRKFSQDPFKINDLINFKTLSPEMADLLKLCVEGKLNIVVSGGTGSGKTTTLNVLSSFIPENERIVTIEDTAELQLSQRHVVRLETRPINTEGKGEVTMRDLVKNSLRMRPDRIIVGEVRAQEALDMLQAMNTGHDGSITTGHANAPRDMLARLETMILMAGMNLPVKAIREQISSGVDLIIQQSRLLDGTRKITHITEVQELKDEIIVLQDIFVFVQEGVDENGKVVGHFKFTGLMPSFIEKMKETGTEVPLSIFKSY